MSDLSPGLTEDTDPLCLPLSDAAELLAHAPWRRFAVIGDSLSAGTGDPSPGYGPSGWADRVAAALRRAHPDLAYLNVAEIGATTARTLDTQIVGMVAHRPDLVHVPSGANDLFHHEPDFARIAAALREVHARAADTGARLTVFTLGWAWLVPAFPDWSDRLRRVNDITRGLAAVRDTVLVDMWDHPVNDRPGLISADRTHFTTSGQAVMAAEIVKGLASILGASARGVR